MGENVAIYEKSLLHLAQPFLLDSSIAATCGTLRRASTDLLRNGFLFGTQFPSRWKEKLALIEAYRPPWISLVPGSFGMFKKTSVVKVGGYLSGGSDMELLERLRTFSVKFPNAIRLLNEPLFLLQNKTFNAFRLLNMTLFPSMSIKGWVSLSGIIVFEWIFPVIELLGLIVFMVAIFKGISINVFLCYLFFNIVLRSMQAIMDVLLDDVILYAYRSPLSRVKILCYAGIESLGYRQIQEWKRLFGILSWSTKRNP